MKQKPAKRGARAWAIAIPAGILLLLLLAAFLIGNEGNGLSKEISDQAGQYLKIPMEGRVESLNASIAAALLMYEAHRQRSARL